MPGICLHIGSNTDFLICAAANRRQLAIFTLDKDFGRFYDIAETYSTTR